VEAKSWQNQPKSRIKMHLDHKYLIILLNESASMIVSERAGGAVTNNMPVKFSKNSGLRAKRAKDSD